MTYQELIDEIKHLPWEKFEPKGIVLLSLATAIEFAESLRCSLKVFPDNHQLQEMTEGELVTDNLSYEDYHRTGDHFEFLSFFVTKSPICDYNTGPYVERLNKASQEYFSVVRELTDNERAMTIFSREQELPHIFSEILTSHDWDSLGLGFYKYYLERHIEIDSVEGGHGDLTKNFITDPEVLLKFYTARRELYSILEVGA